MSYIINKLIRYLDKSKILIYYVKYEVTGLYEIIVIKAGSLILKYKNHGSSQRISK